jgi:hypothetical protein
MNKTKMMFWEEKRLGTPHELILPETFEKCETLKQKLRF